MRPVKIKISSITIADEGELSSVTQAYKGELTEKNGKFYVMYKEDAQSGLEDTKTTLKWDTERIIILRSGGVKHRQEFAEGCTDNSVYQTPYLTMTLLTETRKLRVECSGGVWKLAADYLLYHGEALYGEMGILIEIEEEV